MKPQISLFILLSVLTATASFAGGYVGSGTIRNMQNAYNGWILRTNGPEINPDACSNNFIILEKTHSQYKEIYSILLLAYTTAKPININVSGCHTAGYKKFSFVYSFWNN